MTTPSIFSPEQLRTIVDETIPAAKIPPDHKNAVVGTIDQDGAQVVAVFSLGPDRNWQVSGALRHEWSGANRVGASVVASW